MSTGKLIIITGIDGGGKSTLISSLHKIGFRVSHWRKLKNIHIPTHLNFNNPAVEVQKLTGNKRLDFVWKYIENEWKYVILPTMNAGQNIISDSFYIKFLAKEKVFNQMDVKKLIQLNPIPMESVVIFLDTPPEIALKRKSNGYISPYECFKDKDDFVEFQSLVRNEMLTFIKDYRHTVIDGRLSKTTIFEKVETFLKSININPT